eukprot:TRINITY_DN67238_c3_g8_i2.p1 TRINITY_DN67238_c3_g8~~TRINITY_DN67238_c3_g8_i2.p1  ORF type:complete len:588 (+),score=22.76 TRINITY_DN67238_c3_g8_i2:102-1865(+)
MTQLKSLCSRATVIHVCRSPLHILAAGTTGGNHNQNEHLRKKRRRKELKARRKALKELEAGFRKQIHWLTLDEANKRDMLEHQEDKIRQRLTVATVSFAEHKIQRKQHFVSTREERQRERLQLTEAKDREVIMLRIHQNTVTLSSQAFAVAKLAKLEQRLERDAIMTTQATQRLAIRDQEAADREGMYNWFTETSEKVQANVDLKLWVQRRLKRDKFDETNDRLSVISAEILGRQAIEGIRVLHFAVESSRQTIESQEQTSLIRLVQRHVFTVQETEAREEVQAAEETARIEIQLSQTAQLTKIKHRQSTFQVYYAGIENTGDWLCAVDFWVRWGQRGSRRPQLIFSFLDSVDSNNEAQLSLYLERNDELGTGVFASPTPTGGSFSYSPAKRRTQLRFVLVDKEERARVAVCRTSPLVDGEWHHCLLRVGRDDEEGMKSESLLEFWTDGEVCPLVIQTAEKLRPDFVSDSFTCMSGRGVHGSMRFHTPGNYVNYRCWGTVSEQLPEDQQIQLAVVPPRHNGSEHPEEHPQNTPFLLPHSPHTIPMPRPFLRTYQLQTVGSSGKFKDHRSETSASPVLEEVEIDWVAM